MTKNCKLGFTLLELLIVLVIMSLILTLVMPAFLNRSLNSVEAYENKLKSVMREVSPLEKEFCVNFKDNYIKVGKVKIPPPSSFTLTSLVKPFTLISSENHNSFCFTINRPTIVGVIAKNQDKYLLTVIFLPVGETKVLKTDQAEVETFKDKISKGRILEWFSYY